MFEPKQLCYIILIDYCIATPEMFSHHKACKVSPICCGVLDLEIPWINVAINIFLWLVYCYLQT